MLCYIYDSFNRWNDISHDPSEEVYENESKILDTIKRAVQAPFFNQGGTTNFDFTDVLTITTDGSLSSDDKLKGVREELAIEFWAKSDHDFIKSR